MMFNSGYIPFYREELDDWLIQDPQRFIWWIWLRCRATYKPCMQCVGQGRVEVYLKCGELAVTKTYLKNIWGVNIKTVDRFLKQMITDGRISCRDEKGILIITIKQSEMITAPSFRTGASVLQSTFRTLDETAEQTTYEKATQMASVTEEETGTEMPTRLTDEPTVPEATNIRSIESNNSQNTDIDFSAREKGFFDELKKSALTLEQMIYSLKPENGEEDILLLLDEFINQCLGTDDFHNSFSEFKRHFMNWARKEIRIRQTENKKNNQNGKKDKEQRHESGVSRRRGAEVSARSAADYEKPFSTQPQGSNY